MWSGATLQQAVDVLGDDPVDLGGVQLVALGQQSVRKGQEVAVHRVEQLQGVNRQVGVLGLDDSPLDVDAAGTVDVADGGAHHVAGVDVQAVGVPDAQLDEDAVVVDEHDDARERGELLAVEGAVLLLGGRHDDEPF